MSKNPMLHTLLALAGDRNTITIHRAIVIFLDDLPSAMLLEQLLYWTTRTQDPEGWIIKSDQEWCDELHLKRFTIRASVDLLTELELIEKALRPWKGTQRNAYRVNWNELSRQWEIFINPKPLSENEQRSEHYPNSNSALSENEQSTITEITSETTSSPKPKTKPTKKGDAVDGILAYGIKPKSIRDAITKYFKLTPNWQTKTNQEWMQWALHEQHITPEQIQIASKEWRSNKLHNWQAPNLKGIREKWLQLINVTIEDEPTPQDDERTRRAKEQAKALSEWQSKS